MTKEKLRRCWRAKLLRLACAALVVGAGLMVYAQQAGRRSGARGEFSLAADCPRGALVYAQFSDLPALLRQWNQSELKGQYLDSTNFKQFSRGHLALKLVARWEELNDALGLTLDAAALGGAAERSAALAVYDIGRMEIVFVAPAGAEHVAASRFVLGAGQFEEAESPDGTTYYRREAEVDRGRQQQVICFAVRDGRFVLASSETLLLRALANIGGRSRTDSLADEPSFAALTARARPHFVSVWTDQTRLNDDWYFKHYWLAGNVADLKGMRAGLFALEMRDDKWIEHRDFLLRDTRRPLVAATAIPVAETQRLAALVSGAGAPYVWLRALGGGDQRGTATTAAQQAATTVRDALFDRPAVGGDASGGSGSGNWDWRSFSESDFYAGGEDSWHDGYSSLGADYDWRIDDAHDAGVSAAEDESDVRRLRATTEAQAAAEVEQTLRPARPLWIAGATSPRVDDGLLFVEFRRLAVVTLGAPVNLDRRAFEQALAASAQSRLMIAGGSGNADDGLTWQTRDEHNRRAWRELPLPLLGWSLCYTVRDRELFVANSPELLRAALANAATPQLPAANAAANVAPPVDEFIVIRFDERRRFFDDVVNRIDAPRIAASRLKANPAADENTSPLPSQEFFSGNVASLLDAAAQVHRVEITRRSAPGRLHEEVEIIFVKKSQSHGG